MKKPRKLPLKKVRKRTTLKEDTAKYLLDVSKLILGSVVIGCVLRYNIPQDVLLTSGIAAAILSFIAGLILGIKEIKTGKTEKPRRKRSKR